MNKKTFLLPVLMIGLVISLSACAVPDVSSEPTEPISPITIGDDLTAIDLCEAIPQDNIETVMKVKLVAAPKHYTYRYTEVRAAVTLMGHTTASIKRSSLPMWFSRRWMLMTIRRFIKMWMSVGLAIRLISTAARTSVSYG